MVVSKRPRHGGDSDSDSDYDSDYDCFEIQQTPPSNHHHHSISGTEARLRRRKLLKQTTPLLSPSASKITWTKNDELVILGSIVDYEKETKLSYNFDWEAFHAYIKDLVDTTFTKTQLTSKIRRLKRRFDDNIARSYGGKVPSDDDEIFKLSKLIWGVCASDQNIDQSKDATCVDYELVNETSDQEKDTYVEHERVNADMDREKDVHERVNENAARDEPASNISMENDKGEKEKSEEDGVDEFDALQDALEATTLFQSLRKYQQKRLLQNLKNLGAQSRKELADEWKALLAEEFQLYVRKLTFAAKLTNTGNSA